MGYYINPKGMSKEQWLEKHGTKVMDTPSLFKLATSTGRVPVILVDNGFFTAAAVAFSEEEYKVFTDPKDSRPRKVYTVPVNDLVEVEAISLKMGEDLLALKVA